MEKIVQSKDDLLRHLHEQFGLLVRSSISYDEGFDGAAKWIALSMRTLLHDSKASMSLLKQLGLKNILFCCTCHGEYSEKLHISSYSCLTSVLMRKPAIAKYLPILDSSPDNMKWVSFQKWWDKVVIVDNNKNKFSRQRLIRIVSNKDGGAHVDPELEKDYYELSRRNSLGWKYSTGGKWFDLSGPELASIRQMAHEIILTLTKGFPDIKKSIDLDIFCKALHPKVDRSGIVIGGEVILVTDQNINLVDAYLKRKI